MPIVWNINSFHGFYVQNRVMCSDICGETFLRRQRPIRLTSDSAIIGQAL